MSLRVGIAWALSCGAAVFIVVYVLLATTSAPEARTRPHRQRPVYMTCRVSYADGQAYLNDCRTFTR